MVSAVSLFAVPRGLRHLTVAKPKFGSIPPEVTDTDGRSDGVVHHAPQRPRTLSPMELAMTMMSQLALISSFLTLQRAQRLHILPTESDPDDTGHSTAGGILYPDTAPLMHVTLHPKDTAEDLVELDRLNTAYGQLVAEHPSLKEAAKQKTLAEQVQWALDRLKHDEQLAQLIEPNAKHNAPTLPLPVHPLIPGPILLHQLMRPLRDAMAPLQALFDRVVPLFERLADHKPATAMVDFQMALPGRRGALEATVPTDLASLLARTTDS